MRRQRPIGRRRPLSRPDALRPADPVFVQLCRDLALADDARKRVEAGELERDRLDDADQLERKSLMHMIAYLAATAWAKPEPR
jgi:hypothetical protein